MNVFQQKQYDELKKKKQEGQLSAPAAPQKTASPPKQPSSQTSDPIRTTIMRSSTKKKQKEQKWYSGSEPTEVETLAKIYQNSLTDQETAKYQYGLYEQAKQEGHWAETYDKATSRYAAALGLPEGTTINDEFFEQMKPYFAAGVTTDAGNLSTAKKNGADALFAANLAGLYDDYQKTKVLQAEEAEAMKEAQYWIAKGLTDEEIIQKLNIGGEGSKYSNLTKAFNKTKTGEYEPTTAPIQLLTSYGVQGMLYGLRNPNDASGDYKMDAVKAQLGRGVQHTSTPDEISRRTPGSGSWAPYSNGTTMDDEAIRFGVGKEFSTDWLEKNRDAVFASGDQKAISAFGKVYEAEETTKQVESEYAALLDEASRFLVDVSSFENAEDLIKYIFYDADGNVKYKELAKLDESLLSGQIVALTRGTDYDYKSFTQEITRQFNIKKANEDAAKNPEALATAVENEKEALIRKNGTVYDKSTLPKSQTNEVVSVFDEPSADILSEGLMWASTTIPSSRPKNDTRFEDTRPIYERMAGQYAGWSDEQKEAADDYIYSTENGYDLSESIEAMRSAGLSDEEINSFRSQVSEAISTQGYKSEYAFDWFEPAEVTNTGVDNQQAIWAAIGDGDYLTAAELQYQNIAGLMENSDDPAISEIVHSAGSQKAAATLMTMVVEGRLSEQIEDPKVKAELQTFEKYALKALGVEKGVLDQMVYGLDRLLNMNGKLIDAQENEGLGLSMTLQLAWEGAMSKGAGFVDDLIGEALVIAGSAFKSDALVEQGKKIAATEDSRQAHYNQLLADKGTPLEILAGQYGGEAIHMSQMSKIAGALMGFGAAKLGSTYKFLTRMIGSLPFAAEAGARDFHETYAETDNVLISSATSLATTAVTALMSQFDGVLKNIEASGMPYIPEVVKKLSASPGSGALAGVGRWGKGFALWLGNLGKTAVNEALQEPAENVATTFVTDLIKGQNPFDRDWKEYGKELRAEGAGAALISLGSSASTLSSYARTVKVVESQMGKSELTPADVETFVHALQEDMNDPQIVSEMQERAEAIVVEARTGELVSEGALPEVDNSAVVAAEKSVQEKTEAAAQATAEKDAAYAQFRENPADDAATSRLSAAIKQEQEAVKDAQDAQAELAEAQASVQAQSEAAMEATRAQAESEVQGSLRANVENRLARESVSGYNEPAGGVTNGEANRGYDGRGSSGSNVEGRGGSPQNDRLDSRTAIEGWSPTGEDRAEAPGVITRASKGYEAFEKAVSNSGLRYDDGEPIILYHGTRNEFETMGRMDFAGAPQNYDTSHGIYLTNDINVANLYSFMYGNIEGRQSIHPVALNTDRIARFDADGFGQDPDYQNYVALLIEKYNKYAGKENFSQNLEKALARELAEMNIEEHIANLIKSEFKRLGKIDAIEVAGAAWNFDDSYIDDQYIVFDPSLLVPATEAYWAEQDQKKDDRFLGGSSSGDISRTQVPPQTVQTGNRETSPLVNPIQSARTLSNALGIGERIGTRKMNNQPQAVLGYYDNRARYLAVRPQEASNITVAFHEIGHALSQRVNMTGTQAMIANLDPAFAQSYRPEVLPGEAFAEFIWRYMVDDQQAEAFAGSAYIRQFERALQDAGIADEVHAARDEMHAYVNGSVNDRIGAMVVDRSEKEDTSIRDWFAEQEARLTDASAPLAQLNEEIRSRNNGELSAEENIRNAALMRNTAERRAWNIITGDLTDSNWTVIGEGLSTVLERTGVTGKDFDLLNNYMLALHSLDRDAQGLPVFDGNLTTAQREQYIAQVQHDNPAVARAAQAVHDWWHNFAQAFLVDTGYLSQDALDTFERMYPHYVPTNRVKKNGVGRRTEGGNTYTVRRATGSTEEIYNPMDTIVQNVNTIVKMVSQNNVGLVFDRMYRQYDGLGVFARNVTQDMQMDRVNTEALQDEVNEILTNANTDTDAIDLVLETIGAEQTQWRATGNVDLPNVIQVRRPDGTRAFYEFSDNEMYKAIAGLNERAAASVWDFVGRLTKGMTALTTGSNPLFAVRNFARDFQKSVNYGSWATTYADGAAKWLRAAYEVWRESGEYNEYKALGGGGWTRVDPTSKKSAAEYRGELFKGYNTSNVGRTVKWAGKKLWNAVTLSRLNEIVEQASRYAEYRFGEQDKSTAAGRQQAFLNSQEATVDFSRSGNSQLARDLKQVIPFFNASAQAVYQTGREFLDPAERGRLPARFAKTVANTALASALSAVLLIRNLDDDEKEEFNWLSDDLKAEHIYLPNPFGDTPLIRIPISQDPLARAVHAAVTNAIWKGEVDDVVIDTAVVAQNILDGFNPITGTVFDPLIAISTNTNWYGSRIVPTRMDGWDPTTQYTEETADLFVNVSRGLSAVGVEVSPMMLQYIAEQYSGFVGQIAIPAISKDKNSGEMQGIQAVVEAARKKLTSDPLVSNGITSAFYDTAAILEKVTSAAKNNRPANMLRRNLTAEEAIAAADEAKAMQATGGIVAETKKMISEAYARIESVEADTNLTDREKYQLTSQIRREMLEGVLDANEALGAYVEKYVNGDNILNKFFEGAAIRTSTTYEKLPDTFRNAYDNGESYMQRSVSVWEATGKDGALPKVSFSFDQNKVHYEVAEEYMPRYISEYEEAYEKAVNNIKGWDDLSDDEKVEALQKAHRTAHTAAKKWYVDKVGNK